MANVVGNFLNGQINERGRSAVDVMFCCLCRVICVMCLTVSGHDSREDAKTCMELMLRQLRDDIKKELRR